MSAQLRLDALAARKAGFVDSRRRLVAELRAAADRLEGH
jgi:hypothetical protein